MRLSGRKKPVIITNYKTKLYCYHSVIIHVIEINRNQTLVVLQKYGSMSLTKIKTQNSLD